MLINNITFFNLYNLIYFCTACLVVVSALSSEIKKDVLFQNKLSDYLVLFPLISLIFLIGFREYNVGTDTGNYYLSLWVEKPEINFSSEFLFDLIALVLRFFNLNYSYFLILIACIFYMLIYKALRNYTEIYKTNLLITFFSCMSFFFFLSMSINVIRQGVSLAILLYAYSLWMKKKDNIQIVSLMLLALAFHSTSIIPILIFLTSFFINKIKAIPFLFLCYFISIALSYASYGFLNFSPIFTEFLADSNRIGYFSDDDYGYTIGFKPQFVIFNTFFLFISLYVKSKLSDTDLKNKYNILVCYYIISSIIFFMAFQLPFSDRWGLFSWVIIPFLISPLFYSPFVRGNIKIHFVIMLILIFIGFKFYA